MKKILIMSLAAMLCMASGCQKTPESPIVVGKNMDRMIEQAQQTPDTEPSPQTPDAESSLQEKLACPATYANTITAASEKLTIRIDADIAIPDVNRIPVMRVHPADFSQEIVSMMFGRLCGGLNMMEVPPVSTKSEIERTILDYRRNMGDPKHADSPDVLEWYSQEIARLEKEYPGAPETIEPVPCTGLLKSIHHTDTDLGISYNNTGVDAYDAQTETKFWVQNNDDLKQSVHKENKDANGNVTGSTGRVARRNAMLEFTTKAGLKNYAQRAMRLITNEETVPAEADGKLLITPAEARKTVEALLEGTGMAIHEIYLTDDQNTGNFDGLISPAETYVYKVFCVRKANGVTISYLRNFVQAAEGMFAPIWDYETMELIIGNGGVLTLSWMSPHMIADTLVEDTNLLPFEEAMRIFEKMLPMTLEPEAKNERYTAIDIEIKHISLGLQRVIEQNSIESGLLVPVWNFYGVRTDTDSTGKQSIKANNMDAPKSFLTINAIDGSIIDPQKGM